MSSIGVRKRRRVGRPPGATGERTRGDILDAALEAFAASGFEAMSVRELTRRLDVSHNLVHHHFGSKQDLWEAAIEHGVGAGAREVMELLASAVGSPTPSETLRVGMERAAALLTQRPAVARILADEAARGGPRLDFLYERYLKPGLAILQRFLTQARRHGVREVDPRVAVVFVLSTATAMINHGALARKLGLGARSGERYTAALTELALGGLTTADA